MWAVLPCTCLLRRNLLVIVCLGLLPSAVRPISVTYALRISASVSMYFYIIAERSEANNRDLWAQQSQLAYIYIYFHMGDVCHAWGAPGQQHVFKMASLVVTWMPSSNLWRPKTQTFGQIYHILLPGKAYYSSQVSRVYVHSV